MFERLGEIVRAQIERVISEELRLIEAMFDAEPGLNAVRDGDLVVIEGRRLKRRMIEEAQLRGGWR